MVAMAAAEPAAAIRATPCGESRRRVRLAASIARPPPSAISGASGPTTVPSTRLRAAARITPGRLMGWVVPPPMPSAGMWPPRPGSRVTMSPTSTPATASTRIAYQALG